jgi:hypothetical protein
VAVVTEAEGDFTVAAEGSTEVEGDSTAAQDFTPEGVSRVAEPTMVTEAHIPTVVIAAAGTMAGAVGITDTDGGEDIGVIRATVTDGDSAWASAGGGPTGLHTDMVTALGGDTRILILIRPARLAMIALLAGTTIRPRPIPVHNRRTTRLIMMPSMSPVLPYFRLTA